MTKTNALGSLYGQGHANATRTRECVAMPGKREQTILTPPCIIEALHKLWPEGIELDPCAEPLMGGVNDLFAVYYDTIPEENWNVPAQVRYTNAWVDGLEAPWYDRTYCNPPYGELKKWMAKSASESVEHIMLVPVRTHRDWFQLGNYDAVAFLKPLKFVGFKQAFPAPLCSLYAAGAKARNRDLLSSYGPDSAYHRKQDFEKAFAPLSTQVIFP